MSRTSIYNSVEELPDLLPKGKQQPTTYKSVDELPDLKKKETTTDLNNGGTNISAPTTSTSNPQSQLGRLPTATVDNLSPLEKRYAGKNGVYLMPPEDQKKTVDFIISKRPQSKQKEVQPLMDFNNPRKLATQSVGDNTVMEKPITDIDIAEKEKSYKQHQDNLAQAIENTTQRYFQFQGMKISPGTPIYNQQKAKIAKAVEDGNATLHMVDGQPMLDRKSKLTDFFNDAAHGWNQAMDANDEAASFVYDMDTQQRVDYINKKRKEQDPDGYVGQNRGAGEFFGSAAPMAVKAGLGYAGGAMLAAAAPETGGLSLAGLPTAMAFISTAPDMANINGQQEILRRFEYLKKHNPELSDYEAMDEAKSGLLPGMIGGIAENALMMNSMKMPISAEGKQAIGEIATETLHSGFNMATAATATDVAQKLEGAAEGYKATPEEIAKSAGNTFLKQGTNGMLLHVFTQGVAGVVNIPKVVNSAIKRGLADVPPEDIAQTLDANVEAGTISPEVAIKAANDIAGYKAALGKTADGLTPETQASVAGLIQKKDNLIAEMATKDVTQHPIYQEQIAALNDKIQKITESNDPLKYETDEITGEPLGKTEEPKGNPEEISQPIELSIETPESKINLDEIKVPAYKKIFESGTEEQKQSALKDISDQWHDEGTREATEKNFGKSLVDKAIKEFPQENQKSLLDETKTDEVQQSAEDKGTAVVESDKTGQETAEGTGGKEPPVEERVAEEGSQEAIGIKHAATAMIRSEKGLGEYEKVPQTVEEWDIKARERIKNGELPDLLDKMGKGEPITEVEQMMMGHYIANLNEEVGKIPSKENVSKLRDAIALSDKAGGSAWGRSGRARRETFLPDDSLGAFLMDKEASQGFPLSEKQVEQKTKQHQEITKAKTELSEAVKKEAEQDSRLIAEKGFNKAKAEKKKASKKSHEEYIAERKKTVDDAKEALKKLRTGEAGLQLAILGIRELQAIAPHVKDYIKSLLDEGVDKFDNVVSAVHAEFKDLVEGMSKSDIMNIMAGKHDEKKQTAFEKNNELRLLKREADLLNQIQKARLGEESATSKTSKAEKSRRIVELEKKLAEVKKINRQRNIEEPVSDITATDPEYNKQLQKKLTKRIEELQTDLKDKNYAKEPEPRKPLVLSRKTQLLKDRVIQLEKKVAEERFLDQRSKLSRWEKAWDKFQNVAGIRRVVQTAVDASIWFRQLGALALNPRKWDIAKKFIVAGAKSVFSQTNYDRYMDAIHKAPDFKQSLEDGVRYNELNEIHPSQQNEFFPKSFIYKIPVAREIIQSSQRIADASLNVARYELYNKYKSNLLKQGITRESDPKVYEDMGKLVMNNTGSGNMLKMLENRSAEKVMGATFYGTRLMAANFNTLNPLYYAKMSKEVRMEAAKDLASYTTTILATTLALAAAGGHVSLNPDDSDFLQIRFGKKVYDLTGGKASYIRTFLRWVEAGHARVFKSKYEANKALEFAGNSTESFFRNKLAPNTSYVINEIQGKNSIGQPASPYDILKVYPMYADDMYKAAKDDGYISLLTVLMPNLLGVGYGAYYSDPQMKPIEETLQRNMRSDEMNKELIKNYKEGGRPVTEKEFDDFTDKRDKLIEDNIKKLYEGTSPENLMLENNKVVKKKYDEMSKEEIVKATNAIKGKATAEAKKELFGEKKETEKDKKAQSLLEKAREKMK